MASEPSNPAGASPAGSPDQPTINLQIVSPSVGVNRPLQFPDIPASTTLRQLRARIREALADLSPADEDQRLIYRGRALARDTDTLQDIFGLDALQASYEQTIHLVIRDPSDSRIPLPSVRPSARGPSPAGRSRRIHMAQLQNAGNPAHAHLGQNPLAGPPVLPATGPLRYPPIMDFPPNTGTTPNPLPRPSALLSHHRQSVPVSAQIPEQFATYQQHHQDMTHWLTQLQRETMARVSQHQRDRAHAGMRGIGDQAAATGGQPAQAYPRLGHEGAPVIHIRHVVGPDGQTYRHVEATTGPSIPSQATGLTPTEIQNIIRSADATQVPNQATPAMPSVLQRSASSTSLHNRPLTQPGVTTPIYPTMATRSQPGSNRATPGGSRSSSLAPTGRQPVSQPVPQAQQGVEVYILSSPEGPRALLVNGSASDSYYTPMLRAPASHPQLRTSPSPSPLQFMSDASQRHPAATPQAHEAQENAQVQGQQAPVEPQPLNAAGLAHPNNPMPVGAALLEQVGRYLWLVFRLGVFVWMLATPDASWGRWLAIVSLALFVFLMSTGMLNRVADQGWRPIARHLENLLPAPDRPNVRPPAQQHEPAAAPNREPVPAQMAARLIAERQGQHETWLTGQFRRLERAGLLFLASIAPGVAERHIANIRSEERAERERQEAEARVAAEAAAAAEAEAAAAANPENPEDGAGGSGGAEGDNESPESRPTEDGGQEREEGAGARGNQGEEAAQEPLIAL